MKFFYKIPAKWKILLKFTKMNDNKIQSATQTLQK